MPVPPVSGEAFSFFVTLTSQADTDIFQVNPTLAAGDVTVSTDGGALNNITTLPVVTPAGGAQVQVDLSIAEMTGDVIGVLFSDVLGAEWQDLYIEILTDSRAIGDLALEGADGDTLETLSDQLDLVALEGADGDTLETLSDQIDGVCTLGAGAFTWTYTLTSAVFPFGPIADADIWVTTDIGGLNVIASGRTDAFGEVTFYLDAGPIFVWRQKSGWNFTNPDPEVVP